MTTQFRPTAATIVLSMTCAAALCGLPAGCAHGHAHSGVEFTRSIDKVRPGMTQSQVRAALGNPDHVTKGVVEWNPPPGPSVAMMGVVRVGTPYEDWFYDGGDTHYHVFLGPPGSAGVSNKGEWEVLTTPRASPASAAVAGVDVVPPAR
jgi:hypothetical protein